MLRSGIDDGVGSAPMPGEFLTTPRSRRTVTLSDRRPISNCSPLLHHHIHLDGRYQFTLPEPLARGELRSLRDPNDPAEQVFDLLTASA